MRSIFPPSATRGASEGRMRQILILAGAVVALIGLAWFRAEVRSQFRSLLGMRKANVDTSVLAKGASTRVKKDSAVAKSQPAQGATKGAAANTVAQTGKPAAKTAGEQAKPTAGKPNESKTAATAPGKVAASPKAGAPASAPTKAAAAPAKADAAPGKVAANAKAPAKDTAQQGVMREAYEYSSTTRRDPFVSLLASGELRPTISDLNLMGILYDESGRHPVAVFRDRVSNAQYRVTNGQQLGRMRVARIKPKVVVFTIEEFGMSRVDSLVLGDTTKARAK